MGSISGRLAGFLSGEKARKAIIIGGVVVIALLFLSTVIPPPEKENVPAAESAQDIERGLEERLAAIISEISGAGQATVMVTLESSAERVFAEDEKLTSSDGGGENPSGSSASEKEVVLAGSAKEPLERGVIMPKVRGVAVVCAGASDPTVKEKIANAVAGALGIGISRVYVTC